jgi:glycyl-tRNA synthetase beta chain
VSDAASPRFLLEIGCEEIPDSMILPAVEHLRRELGVLIAKERLGTLATRSHPLGTPRRLAILAGGLLPGQEDREIVVTGPRVEAAYDPQGRPTRALEGFARSHAVSLDRIRRIATPKGECVAATKAEKGRSASEVLSGALPGLIGSIPFAKTMRWGEGSFRFVRPIQWVVCLLGEEVVPFQVAGVAAGRTTRGARFEGSPPVEIPHPRDYLERLRAASVLADVGERRRRISGSLQEAVSRLGPDFRPEEHADLLESVTHLLEHPVACPGGFDVEFLKLPAAVLTTAMIHHQRFFPVRKSDGGLAPHYVAVLNCRDAPDVVAKIRRGNEWVLRARLRDADFFWKEDLKRTLSARLPDLEKILFEATLGSYRKKVDRLVPLSGALCRALEKRGRRLDASHVSEAARLCKADLTTLMVQEFPELQGIMGGLYARHESQPEPVCRAIEQQYLGTGEGEGRARFETAEGAALTITDRLDTLAGFFLLNRPPTGSRDPFGLRRGATALVLATLDQQMSYSLAALADQARKLFADQGVAGEASGIAPLSAFVAERLRHICQEVHRFRYDAVNAALATGADDLLDAFRRIQALHGIRGQIDFEAVALSYRRVRNILAGQSAGELRERSLSSGPERELFDALAREEETAAPLLAAGDYEGALKRMAALRPHLDRFFEKVLVMDPEPATRANRLALLSRISSFFRKVGDFAEMVLEGDDVQEAAREARHG